VGLIQSWRAHHISLDPVRARLVKRAEDWRWSSVRAHHLAGEGDELVRVAPALERYGAFDSFLGTATDYGDAWRVLRQSETSGRPLWAAARIAEVETMTGRTLAPQKRGPKPKNM
jgi:putative transposase